ncbi:MAG: quinoprotein dehydrogenase-associated SoxYZ-like carrier [Marinobacter sp.]|uniref:quinoprotein dehydrogenase-associated SoxYZ-like carrier n=1 Tax=Marinobacter sp. TaxID=50741 RepID=UPI00299D8A9F|nr:quinoprotein dehydrogenase-associated SoxYZ-like carrier [Marinobacter sp.]MDX1633292.1 quinoprotein dehydrogenase-associated SoxYZ-like carrier [Marinobacter sp.]
MARPAIALALLLVTVLGPTAAQAGVPADPHNSPMWEYNLQKYLGDDLTVVHDDRVQVQAPPFAEDSAQVPLTVDLAAFPGRIQRIVAWVDLNPIPHLFTYQPGNREARLIALNFRVQQATTVRAAVLDESGVWHVGSAYVDAAGGGCTAPSMTAANPDWEKNFGTIRGGAFSRLNATRLKANVMHPMDSGMVGNIPAFHIQQVELRAEGSAADAKPVLAMSLSESAAENPMFVFELVGESSDLILWMRDNNGNVFERRFGEG